MNPVNATALYVSASRAVLQCDPRQPHTFADMYTLLPFFRQSLACLVCGQLLQDPISPTHAECQHFVCLGCKGQKMQLRTPCSRCKDYSSFHGNNQLSLLVQCYRKLCLYVTHSPLLQSISTHLGGSPEVMALLEEVLMSHEEEMETDDPSLAQEDVNPSAPESLTPTEAPPAPAELSAVPQSSSSDPPHSNGPQECNGEVLEDLDPSSPELEVCELVEEQPQAGLSVSNTGCGGLELNLTTGPLAPTPGTVCSLRDGEPSSRELEEGEVLLLSVEEVLQTLDPLQPGRDFSSYTARTYAHSHTHHNGQSTRSNPPPVRLKRKRSRSESDREKVKPLPIASILQGPSAHSHTPVPSQTLYLQPPTPSLTVQAHSYSSLSNGAPPKPSRPAPNNNKAARKHVEAAGPKKPHPKARSGGGSKTKDGNKEQRLMSGCHVPPAPVRPPYKKPVEKKGWGNVVHATQTARHA
ncbi:hypothetical protein KUCAC02_009640 [Chaenocephalus aceratus]|nr:hypothetical protein KUCAC02_009640 [Chaenocephalus aceratus]